MSFQSNNVSDTVQEVDNVFTFPTIKQIKHYYTIALETLKCGELSSEKYDELSFNDKMVALWIANILTFPYVKNAVKKQQTSDSFSTQSIFNIINKVCQSFKVHLFENRDGFKKGIIRSFEMEEFDPSINGGRNFPMNRLYYTNDVAAIKEALIKYFPETFKDKQFELSFMEKENGKVTPLNYRIDDEQKSLFLSGKTIMLVSFNY